MRITKKSRGAVIVLGALALVAMIALPGLAQTKSNRLGTSETLDGALLHQCKLS